MKQKPKTVTRTVKLLTNPNPSYVSVVNHGAIQEPFTSLKHATTKETTAMPIKKLTKPVKKTEAAAPVKKSSGKVGVRKIEFDVASYKSEDDVQAFLDANNYENCTITKSDDGKMFTAEGEGISDDDFIMDGVKKVDMATGVVGYVAYKAEVEATEGEDGEGDQEATEKSEGQTLATKFDWWAAYTSKGQSVAKVIADGMVDGVPPGLNTVVEATMTAIGNVLSSDDADKATKVATIAGEFGDLVVATDTLYRTAMGDENALKHENVKKFVDGYVALDKVLAAKTDAPVIEGNPSQAIKDAILAVVTKSAAPTAPEAPKTPEPAKKEATVQEPATTAAFDMEALAGVIGAAVSSSVTKATEALNKRLDDVQQSVDTANIAAKKAATDIQEVAKRVATKKGVETGNENQNKPKDEAKTQKAEEASARLRSTLGL